MGGVVEGNRRQLYLNKNKNKNKMRLEKPLGECKSDVKEISLALCPSIYPSIIPSICKAIHYPSIHDLSIHTIV